MQPQTITLIATASGIGGIGHLLSRSWQREQWLRDKRHEDYQAVLSAVSSAYMAIARLAGAVGTPNYTHELASEVEAMKVESFRVLRDRIFIAMELESEDVLVEWETTITDFDLRSINGRIFSDRFTDLNLKLVRMALHPPKGIGRFRRWRTHRELAKYRAKHPARDYH
jgi:hypothetical protein